MRRQTKRSILIFTVVALIVFGAFYYQGDPRMPDDAALDSPLGLVPLEKLRKQRQEQHGQQKHDSAHDNRIAHMQASQKVPTPSVQSLQHGQHEQHEQAERRDVQFLQQQVSISSSSQELSHDEMVARARQNVFPGADKDHLHGKIGYQSNGIPAWSPLPPLTSETFEEKREHHKGNCFNLRRSDALPLDRHLDDMRAPECQKLQYPDDLPIASVVFVFYNEPPSPLYRSIHSVLNRTPPHLLHEIVLVDDCSDAPSLKAPLDEYLKTLPKIKLVRLTKRSGLMTARTAGARAATGEVVVFLDSHIECTDGWLEPMLARIKEDRKHIVMPIIDSIDADMFTYSKGGIDILAFSWSLGQKGVGGRQHNATGPWPSVIMAGGLFALDRKLFQEIGEYDPEMQLYGGEEMEISFRIWQCGMTLECMPCSRVGHVFRTGDFWKGQVYKVPYEVIIRNKLRTAEAWLGDYKKFAWDRIAPGQPNFDIGPMDYYHQVQQKLQCKPFKWLLDNVYPEMFFPTDDKKVEQRGRIRNIALNACVDTFNQLNDGTKVGISSCHSQRSQRFLLTKKNEIRADQDDYDSCLDRGIAGAVALWGCHTSGGNQFWKWNRASGQITDEFGYQCMEVTRDADPSGRSKFSLIIASCNTKLEQVWQLGDAKIAN